MYRWVVLANVAEQFFVKAQGKVGVHSTLEQDSGAVQRQRLFDLAADLLEGQHVTLRVAGLSVEGTEPTLDETVLHLPYRILRKTVT